MAKHKLFTVATNVKVYFCDPSSPWQRGPMRIRMGCYDSIFPKGTDLSGYSQAALDKIALRLNQRPRETLGFKTPAKNCRQVLHRPVEPAGLFGRFAIISESTLSRGNWLFHIHARAFDTSLGWEALRPNTKLRYDCLHSAASLLFANQ